MATDKLINSTQGDDIIDALNDIADNVGNITYGPQTSADKVVSMLGYAEAAEAASINPGDTLNEAIGKLEKKANDNATNVANKIDKLTNATAGDIATVTATGEIADSTVSIADSNTGLADSDTAVPTSKTVKTYVDSTATGISRYLGTITAANQLSTSAKKGDFYVVKTAWTGVHAGDEIIAEKDGPAQTIDGTNWSLLHNEADTDTKYTFATGDSNGTFKVTPSNTGTAQSVPIKGLGNAAYKGVADTVSTSTDLVTSAAVNTKLASYVPNSDFVTVLNRIGKNCMDLQNTYALRENSGTHNVSFGEDGEVSISVTNANWTTYQAVGYVKPNTAYTLVTYASNYVSAVAVFVKASLTSEDNLTNFGIENNGTIVHPFTTGSSDQIRICYNLNNSQTSKSNSITLKAMLVESSIYALDSTYVPASLYNHDLTVLASEDRSALAEEIDAGAKNLIQNIMTSGTYSDGKVVINVSSDGSFTVKTNSTLTSDCIIPICSRPSSVVNGQGYVLSGCPTGGSVQHGYSIYWEGSGAAGTECADIGNGSLTYPTSSFLRILLVIKSGTSIPNAITFKPMLATKAAFGVSSKFVPYRPNWDLVVSNLKKNTITHSKLNSSYNFHGFKITTGNRASGTAYFMGNGITSGAGVISFSFSLSSTPILYVDKKMVMPSYVKFYYVGTDTFYIVFYTSTKWDDITILGTFTADEVEEYFSNTEIPSGATQLTETAYPTT